MMENSKRLSLSSSAQRRNSRPDDRPTSLADDEFRPLFAAFDKDDNGYIDEVELKTTMAAVGMELSDKDVEMMMKAAGVSRGERIYYEGAESAHIVEYLYILMNLSMR
jgi:Ca2+-binding EF-hand superfamily protein